MKPGIPSRGHTYAYNTDNTHWPAQGCWTWDDYLRLPDDGQRYEIIHGVLYLSPAPRLLHQFVVGRLVHFMTAYALEHGLGAVLPAPIDVLLPGVANPVQPDVVFLGSAALPDLEGATYFQGVPDLVAEVLSPKTRRLDVDVKLRAYERAGIPEYWIVDPEHRVVQLYRLRSGHGYRELGRFEADEIVRSRVLSGFEVKVADLFP